MDKVLSVVCEVAGSKKMAPTKKHVEVDAPVKSAFKCCKNKNTSVVICVKCGNPFHNSCASRDWAEKLVFLDKSRVICCDVQAQECEVNDGDVGLNETSPENIKYLKRLVDELTDKNRILQENADLWKEKFENSIKNPKLPAKKKGKQPSSVSPQPVVDCVSVADASAADISPSHSDQFDLLEPRNEQSDDRQLTEVIQTNDNDRTEDVSVVSGKEKEDDASQPKIVLPTDDGSDGQNTITYASKMSKSSTTPIALTLTANNKNKTNNGNKYENPKEAKVLNLSGKFSDKQDNDHQSAPKHPGQEEKNHEDDGWKTVRHKKHKPKLDPKLRPEAIRGNKESSGNLKVASAKAYFWMFLSQLSEETNPCDIQEYLRENGISESECEKLTTKKTRKYCCFKLGVPFGVHHIVLDGNFWPKGILINKFLNLKKVMSLRGHTARSQS